MPAGTSEWVTMKLLLRATLIRNVYGILKEWNSNTFQMGGL